MLVQSVLVIDDDESWSADLLEQFREAGVTHLRSAISPLEAIEHLRSEPVDVATVDLWLGRSGFESGFDLIPRLKKIDPALRIVVVTDYWSASTYEFTRQLGADAFSGKPTTAEAILGLLDATLLRARPRMRLASLERIEHERIMRTLVGCRGNITLAARILGLDRHELQRKLKEPPPEE